MSVILFYIVFYICVYFATMSAVLQRVLLVGGWKPTATEEHILEVCSDFASVERVFLKVDNDGQFSGSAFIFFHSHEEADKAAEALANHEYQVDFTNSSHRAELVNLLEESEMESDFLTIFQKMTPSRRKLAMSKLKVDLSTQFGDTSSKPLVSSHKEQSDSSTAFMKEAPQQTYSQESVCERDMRHSSSYSRRQAERSPTRESAHDFECQPAVRSRHTIQGRMLNDDQPGPKYMMQPQPMPYYQDVPRLTTFSGEAGKDASFSRWRYEVSCLVKDRYPQSVIHNAIRKSLKSPAAEVVRRLGDTDVDHLLCKFQSLYGTVLSSEAILQRFYSERQQKGETAAAWSCRLEDLMYDALELGLMSQKVATNALRTRFWSGLYNEHVKNALRNRDSVLSFEELVIEARKVEEEFVRYPSTSSKPAQSLPQQVKSEDKEESKMEALLQRLTKLESELSDWRKSGSRGNRGSARGGHSTRQGSNQQQHRICHKCEQEGHLAFGCRFGQDIVCFNCNRTGHIKQACLNC